MFLDDLTGPFWSPSPTTSHSRPSALAASTATKVPANTLLDFATRTLRLSLDPLQRRILEENPAHTLLLCSRQWGKTFLGAIRALWLATTRPHTNTVIVSRTARHAEKVLEDIARLADAAPRPIRHSFSARRLRFPNGSNIIAVPTYADAARGYTAHFLLIDEAAFVDDEVIQQSVATRTHTNGDLWLLSSAGARSGYFFRNFQAPDSQFVRYKATALDTPRIAASFLDFERATQSEEVFAASFLCEFTGSGSSLYPQALCDALRQPSPETTRPPRYYLGLDLGQAVNPSAIVVLRRIEVDDEFDHATYKYRSHRHFEITHAERFPLGTPWTSLAHRIELLLRRLAIPPSAPLAIDYTGIGNPVHKILLDQRLSANMLRIVITGGQSPSRSPDGVVSVPRKDLLTNVQAQLEKRVLTFAAGLAPGATVPLVEELQAFRPDFSSPHSTDLVFALSLALWSATRNL